MKAKLKFFICFIIYVVINIIKFFFKKKIKLFFVYQERIGAVTYHPYSILSKKKNIFFILIFLNKAANNYAYKFWKKYGKQMFNTYMEMKKSIPTQMFNTNPMDMMKGMPDMNKMMSEFQTLSKIMRTKK